MKLVTALAASNSVIYLRSIPYAALMTLVGCRGTGQGDPDEPQQVIDAERLVEEQNPPRWEPAHGRVPPEAPAGNDRRQDDLEIGKRSQEIHGAQVEKIQIDHETARISALVASKKLPPRVECRNRMAGGPKGHGERIPHRVVLVDEEDRRAVGPPGFLRAWLRGIGWCCSLAAQGRPPKGHTKRPSLAGPAAGGHPTNPV